MFNGIKKGLLLLASSMMMFSVVACGSSQTGNTQKQQETEPETIVEIVDATDILMKVWNKYEVVDTDGNMYNDRFDLMGGHFESAVMNMPAKYDLTQASDLEMMYCVPQSVIGMIDDAGTMIHLMKASAFTAGAYHVTDAANVQTVVDSIQTQISNNHWLDGFPDKYMIAIVDNQYVISAIGSEEMIANFETELKDIYGKQVSVQVNENIR